VHHIRITMSDAGSADYIGEDIAGQARIRGLCDNPDTGVSSVVGITRGIC